MKTYALPTLLLAGFFLTSACAAEPDQQHELPPFGANLPDGHQLVYETTFNSDALFSDFVFSDPDIWQRTEENGGSCLELFQRTGKYTPEVRSPHAIALLKNFKVGDFVLEVDVESTNVSAGAHRDTCYFIGFQNPSNFYYCHIAKAADPNAHNIFLVKDAPRTNIATFTTKGVDWGVGIRHRVRIERTLKDGSIRVFHNDMEKPVMETKDANFDWGYVGIGSFDDTARFYALKLYAPKVESVPTEYFTQKNPESKK